jgi:hypothetical protein
MPAKGYLLFLSEELPNKGFFPHVLFADLENRRAYSPLRQSVFPYDGHNPVQTASNCSRLLEGRALEEAVLDGYVNSDSSILRMPTSIEVTKANYVADDSVSCLTELMRHAPTKQRLAEMAVYTEHLSRLYQFS